MKKSGALELLKRVQLKLYHDKATVHQAGCVSNLLQNAGVKSKISPGTSPDLRPIEDAFGRVKQILESRLGMGDKSNFSISIIFLQILISITLPLIP